MGSQRVNDPTSARDGVDQMMPLPSGRSVVVRRTEDDGEHVEVRSVDGSVEIRITLTDDGPVLSLTGARLELRASDTVAVSCRRFEVNTSEDVLVRAGAVGVHAQDQIHMKAQGQAFIDGEYVNLNCLDRTEYGDADSCDDPEGRVPSPLPRAAHIDPALLACDEPEPSRELPESP